MWPFTDKRKQAVSQLSRYISPDVLEELLKHPDDSYPAPRQMFIGYNVIQVHDADVKQLNDVMTKIIDMVFQSQGFISNSAISLLVVVFGAPVPHEQDPANVAKLVATQLTETFPTHVKVVFGSGETLMGSWGPPQYSTYGPMIPLFSRQLEALCQMNYGNVREINL